MTKNSILRVLASTLAEGEQTAEKAAARGAWALGRRWRWLRPLARRYLEFPFGNVRPRHRTVVEFLAGDEGFQTAWEQYAGRIEIAEWVVAEAAMRPAVAAAGWGVPRIEGPTELADWLCLAPGELEWLADLKGLAREGRLGHYRYRFVEKKSGGMRVIEAPKRTLKEIQRRILGDILDKVPAHGAAHGFVKGRSIRTFAGPHVGRRAVLRMDLEDFFPSLGAARIQSVFRTIGYPEAVADLLGCLCTNAVRGRAGLLYSRRHLPQGAPTSPALANICCYRMDCRLAGLAEAAGAVYSRYADDLAFSGGEEFERGTGRLAVQVSAIVAEEGLAVNHRKTRLMRQGVRQHLAGLVVNERMNVSRADFDLLKATLTNCVRLGLESQNREGHPAFRAHLEGRVGFVEWVNPARGEKLREILRRIPD